MTIVGPLVATLASGFLLLILPGSLMLLLAAPQVRMTVPERIAYSAAASWCAIALACVLAFAVGASLSQTLLALELVTAVMGVLCVRQRIFPVCEVDRLQVVMLVAIGLVVAFAYRLGGYSDSAQGPAVGYGWSTMEELLQISTVRKIAGASSLHPAEVMYVKGQFATYFFPVYPFALAALSKISRLDPLIVFETFRLWTASLSLLAFAAFATNAFGNRLGPLATIAVTILIFAGYAGVVPAFGGWKQLIPVSHIGDFALGVLFPLALALLTRMARDPRDAWWSTLLSVGFMISVVLTHSREGAHLSSYIVAAMLAGLVTRVFAKWQLARFAALLTTTMATAALFGWFIQSQVPFIGQHEHANAALSRIEWATFLSDGIGALFHGADVPYLISGFTTVGFGIAAMIAGWRTRSSGVVILVAGVLCWWLPLHVPLIDSLMRRALYSEIMMSPARYIFHVDYLLYGVAVALALALVDRTEGYVRLTVKGRDEDLTLYVMPAWLMTAWIPIAIMLLPVNDLIRQLAGRPLWMLAAIAVMFVGGRRYGDRIATASIDSIQHPVRLLLIAAVGFWFLTDNREVLQLQQFNPPRQPVAASNLESWYRKTRLQQTLPWEVAEMLKTALPQRSVIATDPLLGLSVSCVTDHYVLSSGTNFTTDLRYLDVVDRIKGLSPNEPSAKEALPHISRLSPGAIEGLRDDIATWTSYYQQQRRLVGFVLDNQKQRPIFGESEDPGITMQLLDALRPDYLLVDPARQPRLERLTQERPGRFRPVATAGGLRLVQMRY